MKYAHAVIFSFVACFCCDALMAQEKNDSLLKGAAERELLLQERKNIEADHSLKEASCYKKFSVNSCLESARLEKNAALTENKRRELLLNDLQREEKKKKTVLKAPKSTDSNPAALDAIEKNSRAVSEDNRVDAAKVRAEKANQKQLVSQSKAKQRSIKAGQANAETAKYQKKLDTAALHKTEVEQKNTVNVKPKAASLPVPKTLEK